MALHLLAELQARCTASAETEGAPARGDNSERLSLASSATLAAAHACGKLDVASALLGDMSDRQLELQEVVVSSDHLASDPADHANDVIGSAADAVDIADGANSTASSASSPATGHGNFGSWQSALLLLEELQHADLGRRPESCATVAGLCSRSGSWQAALHLLDEAWVGRAELSAATYGSAVQACARQAPWPLALHCVEEMRCRLPSAQTEATRFAACVEIAEACEQSGDRAQSLQLLDDIIRWDTGRPGYDGRPNQAGSSASASSPRRLPTGRREALSSSAGAASWERALSLMEAVSRRGLPQTERFYCQAVETCAKASQWASALHLLEEMWQRGFEPGDACCRAVASSCERSQQSKIARCLLEALQEGDTRHLLI